MARPKLVREFKIGAVRLVAKRGVRVEHSAHDLDVAGSVLGRHLNRRGFTGGQNSRRIAHHGTDKEEEHLEDVFI